MASMNRNVKEGKDIPGCERLGKLLFLRVDPTLRSLLAVLQRHQAIVETPPSKRENRANVVESENNPIIGVYNPHPLEYEEEVLGLLKAEAELMKRLQIIVNEFPTTPLVNENIPSSTPLEQQMAASMVILMDYISLPVVAILRRPLTKELVVANPDQERRAGDHLRKLHIRQSAERKSVITATQTLKTCLKIIHQGTNETKASSRPESMSPQKILQLVLACSAALPTGREIIQQSTASFHDGGLDRGEDYIKALFEAISCLFQVGSVSSIIHSDDGAAQATRGFAEELTTAMDGALLAHIADVCISAVAPPSTFPESTLLQALEIFKDLLEAVPDATVWRALFPGCFAGLFRTLVVGLRGVSSSTQSKTAVILLSQKVFLMLLRITLGGVVPTPVDTKTVTQQLNFDLAGLKLITPCDDKEGSQVPLPTQGTSNDSRKILGDSSASNRHRQSTIPDPSPNETFISEINKRLPGPLTVLSKLLLTSQSGIIRQQAANLAKILLIESRSSWNKVNLNDLSVMSLESCLVLSRDSDESVVSLAQSVLEEYQKTPAFANDMNSFLTPRILSMIEELPALARRQSEIEFRNKLKLISALLSLGTSPADKPRKHGGRKTLRSLFTAENVSLRVRKALAELFDVDFSTVDSRRGASIEILDQRNLLDSKAYSRGFVRLKLLTPASEKEAKSMVHELGRVLGPKHAALFIDAIVADLLNESVDRVAAGISRVRMSQESWCHEWIGCLTLTRELLIGAFNVVIDLEKSKKKSAGQKKTKLLNSLATSTLPILVSPPLWDLPVNHVGSPTPEDGSSWSKALLNSTSSASFDSFSTKALRGNGCFLLCLLRIVVTMVGLLGDVGTALIPTFLPPVLEMATTSRVEYLKEEAQAALEQIASSLSYKSLAVMIGQNMGVVAGAILARLRLPGGRVSLPGSNTTNEIFAISHTIRSIIELILAENQQQFDAVQTCDRSNFSYILELVMTLTDRYDCLASKSSCEFETTFSMVSVYDSAFRFLLFSYRAEESAALEQKQASRSKSWLEPLDAFRSLEVDDVGMNSDKFDDLSPREGFEAYRKESAFDHKKKDDHDTNGRSLSRLVSNHEINFVSMLLARCSFFVSNASLRLQVESCSAMAHGFRFLAIVALLCKDPEDSTGSAIRRQVSDVWPAIHARLVALTGEIRSSRARSMIIIRQQSAAETIQTTDVSTRRIFLSKLLELIATMADCSGDFMASRFKNDVFPLMSQLLGTWTDDLLPADLTSSYERQRQRDNCGVSTRSARQASETFLIVSMLRCIEGVFHQRACGLALAELIPALGTLVLPFLGEEEEETREACSSALKQMVQIDCDALWRPLLQLSGRSFPPTTRPWIESEGQGDKRKVHNNELVQVSPMAKRAQELVEFVESLPEQPLL